MRKSIITLLFIGMFLIGNMVLTEYISVTADEKPGKPKISLTLLSGSSIKVTISKTDRAQGYQIYMRASENKEYKKLKTIKKSGDSECSYTVKKLSEGRYSFKVKAYAKTYGKTVWGSFSDSATIDINASSFDGQNGIVTIVYQDGNKEFFDISKEKIVLKEGAVSVFWGSYPQTEISENELTDKIINADWDQNGDALIDGIKYKRLSRKDSSWYDKSNPKKYIRESFKYKDSDISIDRGYIWYWSKHKYAYFKYEPIQWDVLDVEDNKGISKVLLLSHYVLDNQYKLQCQDEEMLGYGRTNFASWKETSVRKWLNDEFIKMAFSTLEQKMIPTVEISTPIEKHVDEEQMIPDYLWYYLDGAVNTYDRIFLLSSEDVSNARYGFPDSLEEMNFKRRCSATEYAKAKGSSCEGVEGYSFVLFSEGHSIAHKTTENILSCAWLLRAANDSDHLLYRRIIGYDGSIDTVSETEERLGIRPALYMECKLEKGYIINDRETVPTIGGENVLTIKYSNGDYENFDIRKEIKISRNDIEKIYFGRYLQSFANIPSYFLQNAEYDDNNTTVINGIKYKRVHRGDMAYYYNGGTYFGGDPYMYFTCEPIAWIPLLFKNEGEKKQMLLISEAILVNEGNCWIGGYCTRKWSKSLIREFLNNDFYSESFSKKEKKMLVSNQIVDSDGIVVNDKVFLLSYLDVINPNYGFSEISSYKDIKRRGNLSDYVEYVTFGDYYKEYAFNTSSGKISHLWTLRQDSDGEKCNYVEASGECIYNQDPKCRLYRPVICISL